MDYFWNPNEQHMKFLAIFYSFFLKLRYRIKIIGIEQIKGKKSNIYFPNHQAEVDPQLLMSIILREGPVAPMIGSTYYNLPLLKHLFKAMHAVSVNDLERGSRDTSVLKTMQEGALDALKHNRSILLYPSGQLVGQGYEKIFNKQSAYEITKLLPEKSHVIGVRISGLWGSIWSKAWEGKSPNFIKTYMRSIWYVLANFIFFLPRRSITIEFVDLTEEAKKLSHTGSRKDFNSYLENFYNENGTEKVHFLRHYFYGRKLKRRLPGEVVGSDHAQLNGNSFTTEIPDEIINTVQKALAKELKINANEIKKEHSLVLDLNLDSLGLVSVLSAIEDKYPSIKNPDINSIKTVNDLCLMVLGENIDQKSELKPSLLHVSHENDYNILPDPKKNILENFISEFTKNGDEYFAWDNVSGTSQRKGFFLKTAVVSKLIESKVKGKHVGIMLPALQSTTLLIAASYMAKKIPVMLNWTVGHKILTYCADLTHLDVIITASSFYEKVKDQIPEDVAKRLLFLDKEVEHLSLKTKISGLIKSKFPSRINTKLDETAVILFTSGSEANPKAVPLTHKNIVTDLWGALHVIHIRHNSIFLSFLPPFHSFGFTVLSVLPLISSFKIAYTPNPTDLPEVIKTIRHTRATNVMVTPTFLKMLMAQSNSYDMRSIELVISGAESLPKATKDKFEEMTQGRALIIEGYGITECAPIVALNPFDSQKLGSVGKFIKGAEYHIIHPETMAILPQGQEGMIVVHGDFVFPGYLDTNIESPFIDIAGKSYYKTGDLGKIDSEGFLFITGRLKRFIKIGGEMISLPAIEKQLLEKWGSDEKLMLAVEGSDSISPPEIHLFSLEDMDLQEINQYLKESGFSGLSKIHKIHKTDEIPLLGSGKTDYKILKKQIEN